nr:MAG TPA: hypothetical protein [Caudoviricetes sp.]
MSKKNKSLYIPSLYYYLIQNSSIAISISSMQI